MNIARHVGAWLIVAALIYALVAIHLPVGLLIVGCIVGALFVASEVAELLDNRP